MTKNYIIKKSGDYWDVIETQTEQVVKTCINPCSAQVIKTKLNNGYGFDGWTPAFMLSKKVLSNSKKLRSGV